MTQPANNPFEDDPGLYGADISSMCSLDTNHAPSSAQVHTATICASPDTAEGIDQAWSDIQGVSEGDVASNSYTKGKGIQMFPLYVEQH
jgi:hypothetical protein